MVAYKVKASKKIGWVHPNMASIGIDTHSAQNILDKFDKIVSVSEQGFDALKSFFPKDKDKFIYIENMVDFEHIQRLSEEHIDDMPIIEGYTNIVTVCRISNESKRLDRVVRVASTLKKHQFRFRWYIIGDGPDHNYIKTLIHDSSLQDYVIMLGGRNNPLPYVKKADCFVLTSQFEGKPIAVEEAKILHTPVIVSNYSSAESQVTSDVGIVVPNEDGLTENRIIEIIEEKKIISRLKQTCISYKNDNSMSIDKVKSLVR